MNKSEIIKTNKMIAEFMEVPSAVIVSAQSTREDHKLRVYSKDGLKSKKELLYHRDWNWIMEVVDKIEGIIGHSVDVDNTIGLSWWYSTKKTVFEWKDKRNPFDSVGGRFYKLYVYFHKDLQFKPRLRGESKIEALWIACSEFIKWYNKIVKEDKWYRNYKLPITK
jgi:hypothetical protein